MYLYYITDYMETHVLCARKWGNPYSWTVLIVQLVHEARQEIEVGE